MKFTRCGLDIAKQVFQAHGVDERGVVKAGKRLARAKVLEYFAQVLPCLIGIEACQQYDRELASASEPARRLMQIESIGAMTATAIVAGMGGPQVFKSGRNYAASLGLILRQYSSGGTIRLGPITKQGDRYLRTLLVHGARAHLRVVDRKSDRKSAWARAVKERRHVNVAPVALAVKHPRIVWAMLANA